MAKRSKSSVFKTGERIRLGLWGLGRGMSFYEMCDALNFDVVAGCDFNAHMRERFKEAKPDALVTDNAETFLNADFDAVLLATYCTAHAGDAIACLNAGKHVLSEVTAFHTMAEGVRLVEAVEQSGRIYNLAENYPFTAPHMYLAKRWRDGLFGELMYAEGEYVHEVRSLCYTYIDGVPILPGDQLHQWRSWLHFHYYCTHSLGPIMTITGTRPVRVVSLPGTHCLPGYPMPKVQGLGGVAPSLITMDNGAVVRNLMGGMTNDTHVFRYWGTKGSAEATDRLFLRLGGGGSTPKLEVKADWGDMTDIVEKTGHGGGDFWVMYYFARQILEGERAPFDVYAAADVTIPGILAYRSSMENGTPFDVPDFRTKKARDAFRKDDASQPHYDPKTIAFPKNADKRITGQFTTIMSRLIDHALRYRAYADWARVADTLVKPEKAAAIADAAIAAYPEMLRVAAEARAIVEAYPHSEGGRALRDMLDVLDEGNAFAPDALRVMKRFRTRLPRGRAATR